MNYRELQSAQARLEARGFCVLAFPCNQFGGQEPGTASEILEVSMYSILYYARHCHGEL